jgi:hypothetical protein
MKAARLKSAGFKIQWQVPHAGFFGDNTMVIIIQEVERCTYNIIEMDGNAP